MRMLHTMLRVGNLERSIKFYTETMEMKKGTRGTMRDGGV